MTDDPFDRAAAREAELREAEAWKDDVVRNARASTRQGLIALLVLLPLHLGWDGHSPTLVAIHVTVIGFSALGLFLFWTDRLRRRRPPVFRRGRFNFIVRGTRRGEGW